MAPARRVGRPLLRALLVLLATRTAACGEAPAPAAGDATPGAAESMEVPERIVSLVPAVTQTLVQLGAEDLLVARTDFDTAAAVRDLPSVGGGLGASLEAIVAEDPDLVVHFRAPSDPGTPAALDRLGIPRMAVAPETVAEVDSMILALGRLVDRETRARVLVERHRAVLDRIRERVEEAPRRSAAFVLSADPLWVAGEGSYVGELIRVAGGYNVFDDLGRAWGSVDPETLLQRSPEVILVPPGVRVPPPVRGRSIVREVPASLQMPGPELHEAALEVARALHPDLFQPPG